MSITAQAIPEGFQSYQSPSNFMQTLGVMYRREEPDGSVAVGLHIASTHLNLHGVAHGGFVATVVDSAFGVNVAKASGGSVVTANLSIDYLASAKPGDFVEARVQIQRQGRRMVFAECRLTSGTTLLARATSILVPVG